LIAGFIVVGAALVTQSKYQPPFRVHALLRVTTLASRVGPNIFIAVSLVLNATNN
jgi:hypothetical protein